MQMALAHEIALRLPKLTANTYHVSQRGRLVAVVNMGGAIGLDLEPAAAPPGGRGLACAAQGSGRNPPHFFATSFAAVLWNYVTRVATDLLPDRYRRSTPVFRAIPRVPQRLMKERTTPCCRSWAPSRRLSASCSRALGPADKDLANAWSVLYYAGAITTNAVRAAKGASRHVREAESASELRQSMFPQEDSQPFLPLLGHGLQEERPTMPTPLEPDRSQ